MMKLKKLERMAETAHELDRMVGKHFDGEIVNDAEDLFAFIGAVIERKIDNKRVKAEAKGSGNTEHGSTRPFDGVPREYQPGESIDQVLRDAGFAVYHGESSGPGGYACRVVKGGETYFFGNTAEAWEWIEMGNKPPKTVRKGAIEFDSSILEQFEALGSWSFAEHDAYIATGFCGDYTLIVEPHEDGLKVTVKCAADHVSAHMICPQTELKATARVLTRVVADLTNARESING
jgi:hypothetical protein